MSDTCPDRTSDGWQCNRDNGHDGRHQGQRDHSTLTWDDHGNSSLTMTGSE